MKLLTGMRNEVSVDEQYCAKYESLVSGVSWDFLVVDCLILGDNQHCLKVVSACAGVVSAMCLLDSEGF